jgi:hypothetical protein
MAAIAFFPRERPGRTQAAFSFGGPCPIWVDAVEKVLSESLERNNRIRTVGWLNRNCVRGHYSESMLRVRAHKIVFQQYRSKADLTPLAMSAVPPKDVDGQSLDIRFVPCVDGSELARTFFTYAVTLVGAAMCSAFKRGTRDRWP